MLRQESPSSAVPPGNRSDGVRPVMVLAGTETFLRAEKLGQIQATMFGQKEARWAVVRLDGASTSITAVLEECRTTGMFTERKLVVVEAADALFTARGRTAAVAAEPQGEQADVEESAVEGAAAGGAATARDRMLRYAEAPSPGSVLVLVCPAWPKTTRLHAFLDAHGAVFWCQPLPESDLAGWLVKRCTRAYGKKLDPMAAQALVELAGTDLARLDSELDKLALYALNAPTITAAMVQMLVGFQHEQQVWGLIDALAVGDVPEALRRHAELWLMDAKIGFKIVGPIFYWLRQVFQARELMARRLADGQIIRELKLWPASRAAQTVALARKWGLGGCRRAAAALLSADLAAKSSLGDPRRNLERFIIEAFDAKME